MICLADTDIVLKLAACDLLPPTLEVLGVTRQDVYVFCEEAYRVYRHDPDVLRDYSENARNYGRQEGIACPCPCGWLWRHLQPHARARSLPGTDTSIDYPTSEF